MERKARKEDILKKKLMNKVRIFVLLKYLLKDMDNVGKKHKSATASDKIELHQMKAILEEVVDVAVKLIYDGVCQKRHARLFISLRLAECIRLAVGANHHNKLIFKLTKDKVYDSLYKGTARAIGKLIKIQKAIEECT